MNQDDQKALLQYLPTDIKLSEESYIGEEEFLNALAAKVAYKMQYDSGVFFQLLYKMDVLEPKLNIAMQSNDVPMAIARLILERQLESLAARRDNPAKAADDEELAW